MNKDYEDIVNLFEDGPTETIILSEKDWESFMEVLENPPEPSEELRKAFYKHREDQK